MDEYSTGVEQSKNVVVEYLITCSLEIIRRDIPQHKVDWNIGQKITGVESLSKVYSKTQSQQSEKRLKAGV